MWHPDKQRQRRQMRAQGGPAGEAENGPVDPSSHFREIQEAYAVLVDPFKRQQYDAKVLSGC